jgi:hypothetical protein
MSMLGQHGLRDLLAMSATGIVRAPPAAEGAQVRQNSSLDTDKAPSCFL